MTIADSRLQRIPLSAGEPCWIRTSDLLIKSHWYQCQLSALLWDLRDFSCGSGRTGRAEKGVPGLEIRTLPHIKSRFGAGQTRTLAPRGGFIGQLLFLLTRSAFPGQSLKALNCRTNAAARWAVSSVGRATDFRRKPKQETAW